ncbi:MAG: hypothetical protein JWN40_4830 [Phycisphaerales bacterium]|nr:hypothetical protein [Phycisphaerales bacterium]
MTAAWRSYATSIARREPLLFALLIVIHLIPIWAFTYLPTTDGAAHVANADVMRKIGQPAHDVFARYYFVSKSPNPNLIGHLLLAAFLYIVKPVVAEKLLVSLYIVLFPLSVRYAVRGIRKQATPLAFLAFPMIYSYVFAQGFYNFCLSIPVFFFLVGYWVRHRDRLNVRRGLVLAGLAMLLYASHLFSLLMACGVLGVMTAWFSGRELMEKPAVNRRRAVRRAVITMLALLPGVILSLRYRPAAGQYPPVDWSLKEDVIALLKFGSMVSYRANEAWLGGALASIFGALTLLVLITKITRRSWSRWDALLLFPVGLAAVYLKAHDPASVHFYIPPRVMLYCYLTLLLWLAGQPMTRSVRWAVPPLATIIALAFVASHALKYREFAPQLREFVSAGDHIRPNSTFLPLIFAPQGCDAAGRPSSIDVAPFYMASGYIAAARESVDLRNYEANTDHFPVRFLPDRNPYDYLAVGKGLESIPPKIDLPKFRAAGGQVDYVLVWGMTDEQRKMPDTVALLAQLANGYEEIQLPNAKWTELWKRRDLQ